MALIEIKPLFNFSVSLGDDSLRKEAVLSLILLRKPQRYALHVHAYHALLHRTVYHDH
jgi:hypothetical protein